MARILVIEDEPDIQQVLDYNLREKGHKVFIAGKGEEGLRIARDKRPDLVLLDLMLPDIPGTEVCKQLKTDPSLKNTQVVMLTAKGEEVDRVVGFELGADDYVVKPFSPRELVLRVQAILRRDEKEAPGERIVHEPLVIDVGAHIVRLKNREVTLTATEFKLLHRLARRPGRAYSRDQLLSEVWGYGGEVETRTVDTHMKRLRAKLGPVGEWIETVRGVGYRFR